MSRLRAKQVTAAFAFDHHVGAHQRGVPDHFGGGDCCKVCARSAPCPPSKALRGSVVHRARLAVALAPVAKGTAPWPLGLSGKLRLHEITILRANMHPPHPLTSRSYNVPDNPKVASPSLNDSAHPKRTIEMMGGSTLNRATRVWRTSVQWSAIFALVECHLLGCHLLGGDGQRSGG